ncbi:MAG: Trk system potassium transporter TrkA [Porphyromonas sp.]|uniref:Trk system potassium transporter TrkA n=1 Tax=Porphyromonas sp. TaxID=1924944 RepID=UPI001CB35399|nr:Trk system potassium transporter TrkA [Porphyromonas sp.]MBF1390228.1 Trk system potassium transporter TrkA [Porphyromonas sp.]
MRIVIAGAGEVGTHLAKMLSNEEQNIVLMDQDGKKLERASHHLEVLPIEGSPTLLSDLERAHVAGADLFVGVTPDEATHVMACMLAKRVGARHTIARINNPEYLESEYNILMEELGVDSMIYPEELAAREIGSIIEYPWARQYVTLFNGALALVGVKVRNGAPIVGRYLKDLKTLLPGDDGKYFHVVAIKRDFDTLIPRGNTRIEHNDLVFFTCDVDHIDLVRKLSGKKAPKIERVVIMGASPVALRTISKISEDIQVALIDIDKDKCLRLSQELPHNVEIYHGDGRDPEIVDEVNLEGSQVFIALTENSETNVLACLAAKRYNVYKTVAKEENIDYIPLAYRLDVGTLINKKLLAAGYIYRTLLGQDTGQVTCLSLVNNAEVIELVTRRDSHIVGRRISDLKLPANMTFGGMMRNGRPCMIDGNTVFEPYDHVVIFYHDLTINTLKELF